MTNQDKVRAFHAKYHDYIGPRLSIPPADAVFAHTRYMLEELAETVVAMHEGNLIKTIDGLADLLYVVYGAAIACGLDLQLAFDAVHESNMTKGPLDQIGKGGKSVPEYRPPDIAGVIQKHRLAEQLYDELVTHEALGG